MTPTADLDATGGGGWMEPRAVHELAVGKVVGSLGQRLSDPISLHDMADIAGFSPAYFNQMFCAIVGIPPSRFLTALRLAEAKRLLVDSRLTVTDICFTVGYRSLGTFSSRFTDLVGVAPNAFRQLAFSDRWPQTFQALAAKRRSLSPVFLSHKQTAAGVLRPPVLTVAEHPSAGPGSLSAPIFIGTFPRPIPQGEPVAYTIEYESPIYLLPRVPDGRYYVLAASFPWLEDPRSHLLPGLAGTDLRVGKGDRPLLVRNGRIQNHVHIQMRPVRATDPPLLSSLSYFMLHNR